jgi:hypothetical protein
MAGMEDLLGLADIEGGAQGGDGLMGERLHRPLRTAERLGGLGKREAAVVTEDERGPLPGWQRRDGAPHGHHVRRLGARRVRSRGTEAPEGPLLGVTASPPRPGQVDPHARQPGVRRAHEPHPRPVLVQAHEHLLGRDPQPRPDRPCRARAGRPNARAPAGTARPMPDRSRRCPLPLPDWRPGHLLNRTTTARGSPSAQIVRWRDRHRRRRRDLSNVVQGGSVSP